MNKPFPQNMTDCLHRVAPQLIQWRRDLHRHPEPAWQEFRTSALALRRLLDLGYVVTTGQAAQIPQAAGSTPHRPDAATLAAAKQRAIREGAEPELVALMDNGYTGFWADLDFGTLGTPEYETAPLVAVRVDMDANPLTECTSADHRPAREGFASVHPGIMHACGHDGHVAIGLGLAEVLAAGRETVGQSLRGRVRLLFQPAEEGASGAAAMNAAGAVRNVDRLLGIHLGIQAQELGTVICGTTDFLATSKLRAEFYGKSSHAGAAPQEGRNALLAACTATLHLHAISRTAQGDTRIAVGRMEGGNAVNVIPSWANMLLETRGINDEANTYMLTEARRMVEAAALMWGCTSAFSVLGCAESAGSDLQTTKVLAEVAREMPFFSNIIETHPFGASEDFSTLLREVQSHGGEGAYVQMGTALAAGHHADRFDFDENALAPAVELLARAVWNCIQHTKDPV